MTGCVLLRPIIITSGTDVNVNKNKKCNKKVYYENWMTSLRNLRTN